MTCSCFFFFSSFLLLLFRPVRWLYLGTCRVHPPVSVFASLPTSTSASSLDRHRACFLILSIPFLFLSPHTPFFRLFSQTRSFASSYPFPTSLCERAVRKAPRLAREQQKELSPFYSPGNPFRRALSFSLRFFVTSCFSLLLGFSSHIAPGHRCLCLRVNDVSCFSDYAHRR